MDAHIIYAELKTHADAPTHANKDMHTDVLSTWRSFSNGVFKSVPGYHVNEPSWPSANIMF